MCKCFGEFNQLALSYGEAAYRRVEVEVELKAIKKLLCLRSQRLDAKRLEQR